MNTIEITYGDDTAIMEWDGSQASAPIIVDGDDIGLCTADARHCTERAVRLAAEAMWGRVYDTVADAAEAGLSPDTCGIVIWEDLEYQPA